MTIGRDVKTWNLTNTLTHFRICNISKGSNAKINQEIINSCSRSIPSETGFCSRFYVYVFAVYMCFSSKCMVCWANFQGLTNNTRLKLAPRLARVNLRLETEKKVISIDINLEYHIAVFSRPVRNTFSISRFRLSRDPRHAEWLHSQELLTLVGIYNIQHLSSRFIHENSPVPEI